MHIGTVKFVLQKLTGWARQISQRCVHKYQKVDELYQLDSKIMVEQVEGIRHGKSKMRLDQAEHIGMCAKKVLVNS